jgi:hypothetical protein
MAWQNGKRITGLWANNQANNAWAWVDGLGWRECDWRNNTTNGNKALFQHSPASHRPQRPHQPQAVSNNRGISDTRPRPVYPR